MGKITNRIGFKSITKEGYEIEIIEYFTASNCTVKVNGYVVVKNVQFTNVKEGLVKNPFHRATYGVGYFGQGIYRASVKGKMTKHYQTWRDMFKRCYCDKYQSKHLSYIGCTVHSDWHCFQDFAKWYDENYKEGYQLDKDILFKGNKIYGPDTCCFVPDEMNQLFTKCDKARGEFPIGVRKYNDKYVAILSKSRKVYTYYGYKTPELAFHKYKLEKESHIKEMANKYKDTITEPCYNALMNYEVEITD